MEIKSGSLQEKCLQEAAQVWCTPNTESIEMDSRLCYAVSARFADKEVKIEKLEKELKKREMDYGLLKINNDHTDVLLKSCEKALICRDDKINELKKDFEVSKEQLALVYQSLDIRDKELEASRQECEALKEDINTTNKLIEDLNHQIEGFKDNRKKGIIEAVDKCKNRQNRICGGMPWEAKEFCYVRDLIEYANNKET